MRPSFPTQASRLQQIPRGMVVMTYEFVTINGERMLRITVLIDDGSTYGNEEWVDIPLAELAKELKEQDDELD